MMKRVFRKPREKKGIINQIRQWLLTILIIASILAFLIICSVQFLYESNRTFGTIRDHVEDVTNTIDDMYLNSLFSYTDSFAQYVENQGNEIDDAALEEMVSLNSDVISEINVADEQGIITISSNPENKGMNFSLSERANEFWSLQNGEDFFVYDSGEEVSDRSPKRLYAGVRFHTRNGFLEVGISNDNLSSLKTQLLGQAVKYRHIGDMGYLAVCDEEGNIIDSTVDSPQKGVIAKEYLSSPAEGEYRKVIAKVNGADCFMGSAYISGSYIVGCIPVLEAMAEWGFDRFLMTLLVIILLSCLFLLLDRILKKYVVKEVWEINDTLSLITGGNLNKKVDVRGSLEFSRLSDGINTTVDRLKQLIAEADARIDEELAMAHTIQVGFLPDPGHVARENRNFGLFAMMETAKSVGGDFYDFYMLADDILVVTIADVSDKGIPAALFMMRTKTLLKNLAEEGLSVDEMMSSANDRLWEFNEGSMFVTAWVGFIDLKTGIVKYVHAGHTCPVLYHQKEPVFVKQKLELMLGGMPDVRYHEQEIRMEPGDTLFLYTDGVTEAFRADDEVYGKERLLNVFRRMPKKHEDEEIYTKQVCQWVLEDIYHYTDGFPLSDDITMLCIEYTPQTE